MEEGAAAERLVCRVGMGAGVLRRKALQPDNSRTFRHSTSKPTRRARGLADFASSFLCLESMFVGVGAQLCACQSAEAVGPFRGLSGLSAFMAISRIRPLKITRCTG